MHARWPILAVLTFSRFAIGLQFQSVAAVSHLLVRNFHIDYTVLGTLIGLYLLPGIVVTLPGCMLARRYGAGHKIEPNRKMARPRRFELLLQI